MAVADELLLNVRANTAQAIAGISGVEKKVDGMATRVGRSASRAGDLFTKGLTLPILGLGVAAGRSFVQFETGMAQIQALVGVTDAELAELGQAARDMGREFGVSADEAAGGLFFLKSAGLENAEAIEALRLASIGAASGLGDMETLANGMTTVMTNFGLSAEDSMDKFVMAARKAKADPSDLARILNQNAAIAAATGVSFDQLAGVTAFMTTSLGDARASGTAVKGMLVKMLKPSKMAKDALSEIGVTTQEFSQMMSEDMAGALHFLESEFERAGTENWMGKVFEDSEAIKGVSAILGQTADDVRAFTTEVEGSAGLSAEAWTVMQETSAVKFGQMKEAFVSAMIPIGQIILEQIIPAVEKLTDWVGTAAEWFGNLEPIQQKQIVKWAGIAAAIGPVLKVAGGLIGIFTKLNPWVLLITAAVGIGIKVMDKLGISFSDVWDAIRPVLDILETLWNYFRIVVDDGDYLNDFLTHLPEPMQNIARVFGEVIATLRDLFDSFLGFLQDTILPLWEEHGEKVMAAIGEAFQFVEDTLQNLWDFMGPILEDMLDFWKEIIGKMTDFFRDNWEDIKELWNTLYDVISGVLQDIWDFAGPLIEELVALFKETFGEVVDWFIENWPQIKESIETVLNIIKAIWDKTWPVMERVLRRVFDTMKGIVRGAMKIVQGVIEVVMAIITMKWGKLWDGLKKILSGVWDVIKATVGGAIGWIKDIISAVLGVIGKVWSAAWGGFKRAVGAIWDGIVRIVKTAVDMITAPIQAAIDLWNRLVGLLPGNNLEASIRQINEDITSGRVLVDSMGNVTSAVPGGAYTGGYVPGGGAVTGASTTTNNVYVTAQTNASADQIASEIGWALQGRGG